MNQENDINLEDNTSLYIKGEIENLLFKFKIIRQSKDKILLSIPDEIRVREKRDYPRVSFGYGYEGKVEFFKTNSYDQKKRYNTSQLVDVSTNGLGIVIYSGSAHSWSAGDTISITSINGIEFEVAQVAEIRYMRDIRITRNGNGINAFRVGVQFEREISEAQLINIQNT